MPKCRAVAGDARLPPPAPPIASPQPYNRPFTAAFGGSHGRTQHRQASLCCRLGGGRRNACHRARICSRRLSVAAGDVRQSVSAGRRHRRGRPSVRGRDRAAPEAAGAWSRPRPAPPARSARSSSPARSRTATRCCCTSSSISGFAEVDKLFGREPKFTRDRFHPDRALHRRSDGARRQRQAALQDPEGAGRRRQEAPERHDLQLVRALRRAASADRAVHAGGRHPDAPPADRRRRPRAERDPRQQCAGAGVVDRGGQRAGQGRQGARRWPASRRSAPPRCRTCRPEGARLRRRVLALGRPVRAQGHARRGRSRGCAPTPSRRSPRRRSARRSTISATWSPISTSPTSRSSGTRTPSGSRRAVQSIGKVAG